MGHPAHYHLFRNVIAILKSNNREVSILIKKKDVLGYLLERSLFPFTNILPGGRKDSKIGMALGLFKRELAMLRFCLNRRPDMLIGTSSEITHVGKLLGIPSIVVNEDDYDAVPLFSYFAYPLANSILAPVSSPTGSPGGFWERKTIHYEGFHELAYLHPIRFKPHKELIASRLDFSKPYIILRFAKLTAHHDKNKSGITTGIAQEIINRTKAKYGIYITSERRLEACFDPYRITIDPIYIHHALYYAHMYIGDSQTMAAEAAVLGTPALRFNDFVGKLGYLEELEKRYGLTYGFRTSEAGRMYQKIEDLSNTPNLKRVWQKKREKMLSEKMDVTGFMVWFIENYPGSVRIMNQHPESQQRFIVPTQSV